MMYLRAPLVALVIVLMALVATPAVTATSPATTLAAMQQTTAQVAQTTVGPVVQTTAAPAVATSTTAAPMQQSTAAGQVPVQTTQMPVHGTTQGPGPVQSTAQSPVQQQSSQAPIQQSSQAPSGTQAPVDQASLNALCLASSATGLNSQTALTSALNACADVSAGSSYPCFAMSTSDSTAVVCQARVTTGACSLEYAIWANSVSSSAQMACHGANITTGAAAEESISGASMACLKRTVAVSARFSADLNACAATSGCVGAVVGQGVMCTEQTASTCAAEIALWNTQLTSMIQCGTTRQTNSATPSCTKWQGGAFVDTPCPDQYCLAAMSNAAEWTDVSSAGVTAAFAMCAAQQINGDNYCVAMSTTSASGSTSVVCQTRITAPATPCTSEVSQWQASVSGQVSCGTVTVQGTGTATPSLQCLSRSVAVSQHFNADLNSCASAGCFGAVVGSGVICAHKSSATCASEVMLWTDVSQLMQCGTERTSGSVSGCSTWDSTTGTSKPAACPTQSPPDLYCMAAMSDESEWHKLDSRAKVDAAIAKCTAQKVNGADLCVAKVFSGGEQGMSVSCQSRVTKSTSTCSAELGLWTPFISGEVVCGDETRSGTGSVAQDAFACLLYSVPVSSHFSADLSSCASAGCFGAVIGSGVLCTKPASSACQDEIALFAPHTQHMQCGLTSTQVSGNVHSGACSSWDVALGKHKSATCPDQLSPPMRCFEDVARYPGAFLGLNGIAAVENAMDRCTAQNINDEHYCVAYTTPDGSVNCQPRLTTPQSSSCSVESAQWSSAVDGEIACGDSTHLSTLIAGFPDPFGLAQHEVRGRVNVVAAAGGAVTVSYSLENLAASSKGGIHIHTGRDCDSAASTQGHFWNATAVGSSDPWTVAFWTSDSNGNARGSVTIGAGYASLMTADGHALVVHESAGAKIGCGVLALESNDPLVSDGFGDGDMTSCVKFSVKNSAHFSADLNRCASAGNFGAGCFGAVIGQGVVCLDKVQDEQNCESQMRTWTNAAVSMQCGKSQQSGSGSCSSWRFETQRVGAASCPAQKSPALYCLDAVTNAPRNFGLTSQSAVTSALSACSAQTINNADYCVGYVVGNTTSAGGASVNCQPRAMLPTLTCSSEFGVWDDAVPGTIQCGDSQKQGSGSSEIAPSALSCLQLSVMSSAAPAVDIGVCAAAGCVGLQISASNNVMCTAPATNLAVDQCSEEFALFAPTASAIECGFTNAATQATTCRRWNPQDSSSEAITCGTPAPTQGPTTQAPQQPTTQKPVAPMQTTVQPQTSQTPQQTDAPYNPPLPTPQQTDAPYNPVNKTCDNYADALANQYMELQDSNCDITQSGQECAAQCLSSYIPVPQSGGKVSCDGSDLKFSFSCTVRPREGTVTLQFTYELSGIDLSAFDNDVVRRAFRESIADVASSVNGVDTTRFDVTIDDHYLAGSNSNRRRRLLAKAPVMVKFSVHDIPTSQRQPVSDKLNDAGNGDSVLKATAQKLKDDPDSVNSPASQTLISQVKNGDARSESRGGSTVNSDGTTSSIPAAKPKSNTPDDGGLGGGYIALIVILVLIVVGVIAFFALRKNETKRNRLGSMAQIEAQSMRDLELTVVAVDHKPSNALDTRPVAGKSGYKVEEDDDK